MTLTEAILLVVSHRKTISDVALFEALELVLEAAARFNALRPDVLAIYELVREQQPGEVSTRP